ncbi:DUF2269 domain-containing protein [Corynebacterium halotolerans]|uniref:DUF2269 domain-containing protein n=1 Tax=Corynebacterium halotolerans TaxID=225326 RepID=UPI003CF78246
MYTVFVILHVLTAVLFLGPVTVAVSSFQGRALRVHEGDSRAVGSATILHKITNTYGMLSLLVPILGVAVMFTNTAYWKMGQFHAAIALAVIAWALLLFLILPRQRKMMGALGLLEPEDTEGKTFEVADWGKIKSQLSMFGGIFSLLWVIMLVLMFL